VDIFQVQGGVTFVVLIALLAIKAYAFINALTWSPQHYEAAGKLTKTAWGLILGISLVAQILIGVGLINIVFTVAAIVYLVDVRPALQELGKR
jgi:hypothetical protein